MSNANPLRCAATGVASKLAERIASDTFVVTSELNPPKGIDLTSLLSRASELAGRVDGFNLTDSHTARMSMSPLAAAHLIMDHGHEPIVQLTTRDRNRIALQSDLLGAAALGIPNVVLMGGDDPGAGDHPGAKPVFDFDTEVLIRAAHQLTTGTDFGGKTLVGTPKLFIGAVVNPGAANLDREIQRMEEKVNAGASFFQTQAIYDSPAFEAFIRRVEHLKVAILAGIIPIKSVTMAHYMNQNVPGVDVPDWIIQRIADTNDVEFGSSAISAHILRQVRGCTQGVHIMAMGWERLIPDILDQAEA